MCPERHDQNINTKVRIQNEVEDSEQECIPVGSVPSAAVTAGGGRGCLPRGFVCPKGGGRLPRGCLPGGGVYPSMH